METAKHKIERSTRLSLIRPRDLLGQEMSMDPGAMGLAEALLSVQGRRADEIWTNREWTKLCMHLHNENQPKRFIMGFRTEKGKEYKRSKNVDVSRAIAWAWGSITGRSKLKLAFAPYSMNDDDVSRWGGMDFDAHDGDEGRARKLALEAFRVLLNTELVIILEHTGAGWHLWAIAKEFHRTEDWVRLLKSVAQIVGVRIEAGICEIFPPDSAASDFGKGVRAPGSWNPSTETCNEVYWQNAELLLERLPDPGKVMLRRVADSPDKKKKVSFSPSPSDPPPLFREDYFLGSFPINRASIRNNALSKLVGTVFHQLSKQAAKRLAAAQFEQKSVPTKATLTEHLKDFESLWEGLNHKWKSSLSATEIGLLNKLSTENERDVFRILRSFSSYAEFRNEPDFPVSRDNLASRLGTSKTGAAFVRDSLSNSGVIKRTTEFKANCFAARYRWLLEKRDHAI